MTPNDPRSTIESSIKAIQEVDLLCDEFESAWKEGNRPHITDYLKRVRNASTSTILIELVKLDLYYREQDGDTPALADYETQFPDYEDVFLELQTQLPTFIVQARTLGHFKLVRHVGRGGFGDVWDTIDTKMQRRVALKTPHGRDPDPALVQLLLREAQSAAQLDHPGIARVYEQGEINGRAYIISEFVEGPTLAKWVKYNDVTHKNAAQVCLEIAEALAAAHKANVVHRDLKPSNILMSPGNHPKLVDFGLAKRLDGTTTIGEPGTIMGTLAYMSPEQARGSKQVDGRSDIYSLGAILYELLTNRVLFKGTLEQVLDQIFHATPGEPRTFNQTIPKDLETICLKAIEKLATDRYQTAQEFADDLRRYLDDEPILGRRLNLLRRATRWVSKNRATAGLIGLAGTVSLALGGFSWSIYDDYRSARQLVSLDTVPSGANVIFVPRNARTGELEPEHKVRAGKSPVKQLLLPGDYLVVAYMNEEFFHEVYRHIPDVEEAPSLPPIERHRSWRVQEDGGIGVRRITLAHQSDIVPDMVRSSNKSNVFLDETELTIGGLDANMGRTFDQQGREVRLGAQGCAEQFPAEYAARCLSFDKAVLVAERLGKRLPTWDEYREFMPDGQFPDVDELTTRIPVYEGDVRSAAGQKKIYGLFSNVAEWTMTLPNAIRVETPDSEDALQPREFTGGNGRAGRSVFGPLTTDDWNANPNHLNIVLQIQERPTIGMRGARSARPRFTSD